MNIPTQIRIDVSSLSSDARAAIRDLIAANTGQAETTALNRRPSTFLDTLSVDLSTEGPVSHIDVAVDARDIVADTAFQHGTSVFATGQGGLELTRIELARAGIAKRDLDLLTTDRVSLRTAVATYLVECTYEKEATSVHTEMSAYAKLLGIDHRYNRSFNAEVYFIDQERGGRSGGHQFCNGVFLARNRSIGKTVILKVSLPSDRLRAKGWETLESWRNAYDENRYASIFKEFVRGLFRLDEKIIFRAPREKTYEKLGVEGQAADFLRGYIAGHDPMVMQRFGTMGTVRIRKQEVMRLRNWIRDATGYDVNIPWLKFRQQHPALLSRVLEYPGDFQPSANAAPTTFCKATWPDRLGALRQQYIDSSPKALADT